MYGVWGLLHKNYTKISQSLVRIQTQTPSHRLCGGTRFQMMTESVPHF
jgi:hypothetical protein